MKRFSQVAFLVFVLFFAACGRDVPVHRPGIPITKEQLKKTKDYYFKEIEKLEKETDKKEFQVLQKRRRGYNTSDSELKIKEARDLLGKLFDDVLREKFEKINEKGEKTSISDGLEAVKQRLKEAIELLKIAPEFGEKAKKEKGIFVKPNYSIDQAAVYQLLGEPDKKITGPYTGIRLYIIDPTAALYGSRCFNPRGGEFILQYPPEAEIWEYEGRWTVIFVSNFNGLDALISRDQLNPHQRDMTLLRLCQFPGNMGSFKQISTIKGRNPHTSPEEVITYLLARQGLRIPLGSEALTENAKSSAALPDLNFVSMVFNTNLFVLTNTQKEKLEEVKSLLMKSQPGFNNFFTDFVEEISKIIESELKEAIVAFKKENFRLPTDDELEDIKINIEKKHAKEIRKAREKIYKSASKKTRKIVDSFNEIANWQATLNPKDKPVKNLLKQIQKNQREEIKIACDKFADVIKALRDEFKIISPQLRNYIKNLSGERWFLDNDFLTIFFLVEGVRYLPVTLDNGLEVDEPNLVLKVKVRYKISKEIIEQLGLDPEKYAFEHEIKIEQANRIFKEYRNTQRLTSFGIFFPFKLRMGRYEIQFELIDRNRENMIATHIATWNIRPSE